MQTNSFYSIFSNILRYTAKRLGVFLLAFQASSSQATSKNITENFRRYKGHEHTNKFLLFPKKMFQACSPLLGRGWGRLPLGALLLHFRPPRRKRHLRISQKILEDIKVVSIQTNSFCVLRRCCKFVLPSLGGAGGGSHQESSYLHFSPPRRKRHLRISQKILEDIKAVSMQTNSFYSIFSNILRYTAKRLGVFLLAVQSSSSQATSENI